MNPVVVALDGPSGVGKTAAGMALAQRLDAVFVDTGIFYRAVTLLALQRGIPTGDGRALADLTPHISLDTVQPATGCRLAEALIDNERAGEALRSPEVEAHVSEVASQAAVRDAVLRLQREAPQGQTAVVAGRDIGTVVFPDAVLKVYMDASPSERALRRARQLGSSGGAQQVAQSLAARDARDSGREVAPLAKADDAVMLDTDTLSLEQVVDELERLARQRMGQISARD